MANIFYVIAVGIVLLYLLTNLNSTDEVKKWGSLSDLPIFFGTVIFAFEGIAVVGYSLAAV